MLPFSVGTFRRVFGKEARYLVATDAPGEVRSLLGDGVELVPYDSQSDSIFNTDDATWRKWCPRPRCAPGFTELYVDSDVFLVGDPTELRRFDSELSGCYLAMQEAPGTPYFIGRFGPRLFGGLPPLNAGFLGQHVTADITTELTLEFDWWKREVSQSDRHYHDEQGAVNAVLARRNLVGDVELLPHHRYCIVNHRANASLTSCDGIVVIHACMGHSAFRRFFGTIEAFMNGLTPLEGESRRV